MIHTPPIPDDATVDDPLWTARFYDLANALILCGTKAKIVSWATGLSPKQVSDRYLRLTGKRPPLGRNGQADPKSYARPSKRVSRTWTLQCAIYSGCYERLKAAMNKPVHKAWLLYIAYEVYLDLTQPSMGRGSNRTDQITINVAYDLISHTQSRHPTLKLHPCPDCGIRYLVLTAADLENQNCPLCEIQKNCDHLIRTGTQAASRKYR